MDVLPKRFGKYGLTLHPEKTRLVPFQGLRPGAPPGPREERPGTFDFLGFTHYWGRTLKGTWTVKRKTAKDRFRRSLKSIAEWCRKHRHLSLSEQQAALTAKLRGHFAYYGITGNSRSLSSFRHHARRAWHKWLSRRSSKAYILWERFGDLERRYPLPPARLNRVRQVT
jgi:RNA-directed DNA polymerase